MISVVLEIAIVLAAALLLAAVALLRGMRRAASVPQATPPSPLSLERIGPYRPETIAVRYGAGRGPHDTHLN